MKENLRKIFNTVSKHLLTQNRKAVNDVGNCKYRYGNLKCAAGCLMIHDRYPVEKWKSQLEELEKESKYE